MSATKAGSYIVCTDPGHVFVPTVDGRHQAPIDENGRVISGADLDKVVACAQENGVRLSLVVTENDGASAPSATKKEA